MAKGKILVVDDEEDILDILSYALSKEGYEVVSAESGEKCLELTASHIKVPFKRQKTLFMIFFKSF